MINPKNDEGPRANRGHSPNSGRQHDQYTTHIYEAQEQPLPAVDLINSLGDEWGAPWLTPIRWDRVPPMRLIPWGGNHDYFARHREILADFHAFNVTRTQTHLFNALAQLHAGVPLDYRVPVIGCSFFLLEPPFPSYFNHPTEALYAVCITYVLDGALRVLTVGELSDDDPFVLDDEPPRANLYVGWGCPAPLHETGASTR